MSDITQGRRGAGGEANRAEDAKIVSYRIEKRFIFFFFSEKGKYRSLTAVIVCLSLDVY